jgi:hypothetical protein
MFRENLGDLQGSRAARRQGHEQTTFKWNAPDRCHGRLAEFAIAVHLTAGMDYPAWQRGKIESFFCPTAASIPLASFAVACFANAPSLLRRPSNLPECRQLEMVQMLTLFPSYSASSTAAAIPKFSRKVEQDFPPIMDAAGFDAGRS